MSKLTLRKAMRPIAAMLVLLALGTPAGAAETAFGTRAQQRTLIANICGTQLAQLSAAGCACLAERAMNALDDPQREYLILTVVQPQAAQRMEPAHSPTDLKAIAGFLDDARKACSTPAAEPATGGDAPAGAASGAQ